MSGTYDPAVQRRIESILTEVKDPETNLSLLEINLVRRVRVNDEARTILLDVPFDAHTPGCLACAGIAMTVVAGIRRELTAAFEREFPDWSVDYM